MQSLQRQLQRNMLLTLALVLAALLILVNTGVKQLTQNYVVSRLQHDAESIIAALTHSPDGQWHVDSSRLPAVYGRVKSGHYFRVLSHDEDIRSRSLWDHVPEVVPLTSGQYRTTYLPGLESEQWLSWSQGIRKQNIEFTVWVAEDISELASTRHRYNLWVGTILLLTILVLVLAQHWILKRGFHQLDSVTDAIKALHAGDFSAIHRNLPLEVQPLVKEIERLLERLQQRVGRSRNALGNLAHEMKRPLQQLRLLAATLPADTRQDLQQALNTISHLVERELKRARIVGVSSPGRQTLLADELPTLLALLQKIYPQCTLRADYPPALVLPQDRDDMLELLGNLLDNACQYGQGVVLLKISEHENEWRIQVEDNGPGIPTNDLTSISTRGVRLDESQAGSGLGLAICSDIATSYQGQLRLENLTDCHGLRVTVTLPKQLR